MKNNVFVFFSFALHKSYLKPYQKVCNTRLNFTLLLSTHVCKQEHNQWLNFSEDDWCWISQSVPWDGAWDYDKFTWLVVSSQILLLSVKIWVTVLAKKKKRKGIRGQGMGQKVLVRQLFGGVIKVMSRTWDWLWN